jgi:hypothetical protein
MNQQQRQSFSKDAPSALLSTGRFDGRSRIDHVSDLANAFLFSRAYTVFIGVHVVINLALFIWEMATVAGFKLPSHGLFVFLEVWVNFALVFEIILRVLVQRKEYLKDKRNWFDVAISFASIVTLTFLFFGNSVLDDMAEELTLVLLAFRYIIVLLRVAILIKNQGANLATEVAERVEIDSVEFRHSTVDLSQSSEERDRTQYVDEDEKESEDERSEHEDL